MLVLVSVFCIQFIFYNKLRKMGDSQVVYTNAPTRAQQTHEKIVLIYCWYPFYGERENFDEKMDVIGYFAKHNEELYDVVIYTSIEYYKLAKHMEGVSFVVISIEQLYKEFKGVAVDVIHDIGYDVRKKWLYDEMPGFILRRTSKMFHGLVFQFSKHLVFRRVEIPNDKLISWDGWANSACYTETCRGINTTISFMYWCAINPDTCAIVPNCMNGNPIDENNDAYQVTLHVHKELDIFNVTNFIHFGTLLHIYRDCALKSDSSDVDFLVPISEMGNVINVMDKDPLFHRKHTFGKLGHHGFEVSYKHNLYKTKVDFFSINTEYNYTWSPLWVNNKLKKCQIPLTTGHRGWVVDKRLHSFPVIDIDINSLLEAQYGEDWNIPIPSKSWNWINPRCT